MGSAPVSYGDDLSADLYFPVGPDGLPSKTRLPVVVWLHPYAYPSGYSRDTRQFFAAMTKRGFAVLGFDQLAFGTRVRDARYFYQRYPHWSLLGKMIADTRAATDAISSLDGCGGYRRHTDACAATFFGIVTGTESNFLGGRVVGDCSWIRGFVCRSKGQAGVV